MPRLPNLSEITSTLRGARQQAQASVEGFIGNKQNRPRGDNYDPAAGGVSDTIPLPSGGKLLLYITKPHAPGFEGGHPEVSWDIDGATRNAVAQGTLNRRTVAREAMEAVSARIRAHAAQHNVSAYTFMPITQSRRRINRGMSERDMKGYEYIQATDRADRPRDPFTGKREASIQDILVQSPSLMQDIAFGLAGTAPLAALAAALTEEGQAFLTPDTGPRRPSDFISGEPR